MGEKHPPRRPENCIKAVESFVGQAGKRSQLLGQLPSERPQRFRKVLPGGHVSWFLKQVEAKGESNGNKEHRKDRQGPRAGRRKSQPNQQQQENQ